MTKEERKNIYTALSAPFPDDAIQRTDGKLTGRGYDTTGIGYQHVVNRLNEVLGLGGFRTQRTTKVREMARSSGRQAFEAICEITVEIGEWVQGTFVPFGQAVADGGHISSSEADARKGAYTNAFKKCAAFFGCGRQAYEGSLDDDHVPADDGQQARRNPNPAPASGGQQHSRPAANPPRERLTSPQLNAIKAIIRKRGIDAGLFKIDIQKQYGVTPEFLTRKQASDVISRLDAGGGNGQHNGGGNGASQAVQP